MCLVFLGIYLISPNHIGIAIPAIGEMSSNYLSSLPSFPDTIFKHCTQQDDKQWNLTWLAGLLLGKKVNQAYPNEK
jgi:hypothetical protein